MQLPTGGGAGHVGRGEGATGPVRARGLADALDRRIEFGVWGGMTERERRSLLCRRPDVGSWAELLERAARDHGDG